MKILKPQTLIEIEEPPAPVQSTTVTERKFVCGAHETATASGHSSVRAQARD